MLAQSETWSDYKHHNTWKVPVAVTQNGQVSFISDLWGEQVSDKQITGESGVLICKSLVTISWLTGYLIFLMSCQML